MSQRDQPGLGELLRYVGELVERGADDVYSAAKLPYRARYTPVLRALAAGAETIGEITERSHLTQGAISQSVALMVVDGLIARRGLEDGRKSGLVLTRKGDALLRRLRPHWRVTFAAIADLEREIGQPLMQTLQDAAAALERTSFAARLEATRTSAIQEEVDG